MQRRTQWLIERATHAMLHWLAESERLNARYSQRMAEEAERAVIKGLRGIDGRLAFGGTTECRDLLSNGVWAHRKVRSYSAVVQALTTRSLALGDTAMALDRVLDDPDTHPGVFDFDSHPGEQQPPRRSPHVWSWGLRHRKTEHSS